MDITEKSKCKVPFGTMSVPETSIEFINIALKNNQLTNGPYVQVFEKQFANVFGVKHAIAVSSGTDALTIALSSLYDYGATRGDEVILPALTFVASANAVVNAGFKPVFVDVHKDTLNIEPMHVRNAVTPRTIAVLPVHLMGKPADIDLIKHDADQKHIYVIEDTAEAHGAKYNNRFCGTIGLAGCFSLYAAHIITSIEGGMIITNEGRLCRVARSLRNHGLELKGSDWTFERMGFSSKMNELEASVGIGNIYQFDDILLKRRDNLHYLMEAFQTSELKACFQTIEEKEYEVIGPHAFPIILKQGLHFTKEEFVSYLSLMGIDNRNLFYSIPTQCPNYHWLGHKLGDFPNSEYISNMGTHIGVHQDLTKEQLDYIIEKSLDFVKNVQ